VEEGAAVVLVDTDKVAVETAATGMTRAVPGARVLALVADLTSESEARRVIDDSLVRFEALHTLVNVAGVRVYQPLAEADATGWEFIIGVNVLATAYCCKAALPALRATGRGTIVSVSSVYALMWRAGMGQYDTTKAAVLGFTRALAVEEAPHGIRVNAVCPGGTITPYHIRRAAGRGVSEAELRGSGVRTICSAAGRSRGRSHSPFCFSPPTSRRISPAPLSWRTPASPSFNGCRRNYRNLRAQILTSREYRGTDRLGCRQDWRSVCLSSEQQYRH
jgi:NAD(P)-dependent dehydrogenase (short-subunit alcohol dehydrogenase family)